jgi:hypothetical protein
MRTGLSEALKVYLYYKNNLFNLQKSIIDITAKHIYNLGTIPAWIEH